MSDLHLVLELLLLSHFLFQFISLNNDIVGHDDRRPTHTQDTLSLLYIIVNNKAYEHTGCIESLPTQSTIHSFSSCLSMIISDPITWGVKSRYIRLYNSWSIWSCSLLV